MSESRRCGNCGAAVTADNLRFCGFCGTELPVLETSSPHVGKPLGDWEARFAALENHPSIPGILKHRPRTGSTQASMVGQGIFGLIFTALALGMVVVFGAFGGPMAIFPMFFVVIGIVVAFTGFKKSATFSAAPLKRFRAGIVDERIKVSGGGENSRARTQYYATLQDQDGERREYLVNEDIAAVIAPGDVGVAFAKSNYLLDFTRVDV